MGLRIRSIARGYAVLALILLPVSRTHGQEFGEVHFSISCSLDAQRQFDRAIAMLHSFFFPETIRAFMAIAQNEPSCAMAYWGIAISQRPNPLIEPFSREALKEGAAAIQKGRAAGQQTAREREWIEALAHFFEGYAVSLQSARTLNYEAAMRRLHEHYPEDSEAAIFYALALLEAVNPGDRSYRRQLQAATILEQLDPKYPTHPGISHYLIHAYDYPGLAERGLAAAARCTHLAPAAPHALHMPSHIFARLGMWPDVIAADTLADKLTQTYARQANPGAFENAISANPARFHSLDFLTSAYLQLAQDKKARSIVDIRDAAKSLPGDYRYSGHTAFAAIPVRYAFERGAWAEAATLPVPKTPFPQAEAITWFARALGSARSGDPGAAVIAVRRISDLHQALRKTNDQYWAEQVEIQRLAALAWIALDRGRADEALDLMRQAADRDDVIGNHVAMEIRLSPIREMLGEMMLEVADPASALREFKASLKTSPNRYRSFVGAATAAHSLGDEIQAVQYYELLLALTSSADTDRPDLAKAREILRKNRIR
jgi:hypothetical protein